MGARNRASSIAVAAVLGLAAAGCTGDGGDDDRSEEREFPQTLAAACAEVSEILQPDDFEDGDGAIDYALISSELNAFVENSDDAQIDEVFQPLADAADQQVAVAEQDEALAEAQEELLSDPSSLPTELRDLEEGETYTFEVPGAEVDPAQVEAANTAFQSALDEVDASCEAEGEPLVDPDEVASENAELDEELETGDPNDELAPSDEPAVPSDDASQG